MARDKGTGKKQKLLDALKVWTSHITAVPGRRDPQKWGLWSQLRTPPAHGDRDLPSALSPPRGTACLSFWLKYVFKER